MSALASDLVLQQSHVDGAWVDSDSGAAFAVVNPATGATMGGLR